MQAHPERPLSPTASAPHCGACCNGRAAVSIGWHALSLSIISEPNQQIEPASPLSDQGRPCHIGAASRLTHNGHLSELIEREAKNAVSLLGMIYAADGELEAEDA
jgi:hypothetical protein